MSECPDIEPVNGSPRGGGVLKWLLLLSVIGMWSGCASPSDHSVESRPRPAAEETEPPSAIEQTAPPKRPTTTCPPAMRGSC